MVYSLDYLIDEYNIDTFNGSKNIDLNEVSLALVFVYFKETIFYVLVDGTNLILKKNTILILPTKESEKTLKKRWMAMMWDKQSYGYDFVLHQKIFMNGGVKNINSYIMLIRDSLFDKVFYLNTKYINKDYFNLKEMIYLDNLCKFFACLLYSYYSKKGINVNDKIFSELEVNDTFIKEILETSYSKPDLNKGFIVKNNNLSFIDGTDTNYVLRKYFDDYLKSQNKNTFNTKVGSIFEEYIFNYINNKKEEFKNYKIFKLGERTFSEKIDKEKITLDIDLVLYDIQREKYFIIQVKYSNYAKAYLKEEVHHYCNSKDGIDKGIKQLTPFEYFYTKDDELKEYFNKKGIYNLNLSNSHLILLHTMPIFDFSNIDNVILYEWNTFRNLLQNGIRYSTAYNLYDEDFITQSNEVLEIEDVDGVVSYLLNSTIISKEDNFYMNDAYNIFKDMFNFIQAQNYEIQTNIK